MKTLINKIKEMFNKPRLDKREILELISLEAWRFEPDWGGGERQNFCMDIPYKGGHIYLMVFVRFELQENYLSVYNDPIDEPDYSVHVFDFDFELWSKNGDLIENLITIDEIKQALSPIEIIN